MVPRYPFVHIDVPADDSDAAGSLLFDLGAEGLEERDASTLVKGAVGLVTLVASFTSREDADAACSSLDAAWNPRVEEIVGDEWRDEWKKHFKPFLLCDGIMICPPWEAAPATDAKVLTLEPGRAFGTGLHETTSLVAAALKKYSSELAGVRVLDVGCGTGILSFVALELGASSARLIDNDGDVVEVVEENAARNGFGKRIECDTTPVAEITETFPVVVANIEAFVLTALLEGISRTVKPGGLLVLSGILLPQEGEMIAVYKSFTVVETFKKGEWVAIVLRK